MELNEVCSVKWHPIICLETKSNSVLYSAEISNYILHMLTMSAYTLDDLANFFHQQAFPLLPGFPSNILFWLCRNNNGINHDNAQLGGTNIATQSLVRHGNGPFRHCLFPVCFCGSHGVRHTQLLLLQRSQSQTNLQQDEKIGEHHMLKHLKLGENYASCSHNM